LGWETEAGCRAAAGAWEAMESERLTRSLCADTFRRALARLADAVRVGRRLASSPSPRGRRKIRARRLAIWSPSPRRWCVLARACMHGTALTGFACTPGRLFERRVDMDLSSMTHEHTARYLVYCFVE